MNVIARRHGVIVRAMGDRIAFCPPLVIELEDTDEMVDRFTRVLDTAVPVLKP